MESSGNKQDSVNLMSKLLEKDNLLKNESMRVQELQK
jgi:hypothetical protein